MSMIFAHITYDWGKRLASWRLKKQSNTSQIIRFKASALSFLLALIAPFVTYQIILFLFTYEQLKLDVYGFLVTLGTLVVLGMLSCVVIGYMQTIDLHAKKFDSTLELSHPFKTVVITIIGMFVTTVVIHILLRGYLPETNNNQSSITSSLLSSWSGGIITILIGGFVGPLIEEGIFRMTIIGQSATNRIWRTLLSIIIFALLHVTTQLSMMFVHPLSFLALIADYLILGGTLAVMYCKTNQIKYGVLLHVIWNCIALVEMAFI